MKTTKTKRAGSGRKTRAAGKGRARDLVPARRADGAAVTAGPERVPLLPLRGEVMFPYTVLPLVVNRPAGIRLIDEAMLGDKGIALATQIHPDDEEPGLEDLFPMVCVGSILKMLRFPDGSTRVVCQGQYRARLLGIVETEPYPIAVVEPVEEVVEPGVELDALVYHVNQLFQRMIDQSGQVPEELQVAAMNTHEPGRLADLLGSSLPLTTEERHALLAEVHVRARLEILGGLLARQLAILELSTKIRDQVGSELTRAQREHFLRQQIKAIQEELGEDVETNPELAQITKKLEDARPSEEAMAEARRELERLAGMHPSSAEYSIIRTYLDWLAALPWSRTSRDRLDLKRARTILDADHYNLEKLKERILEYLAVRKLKKDMKGPILCFAGPPGTGKTSLGKSIARALGREFVRVSLGGIHDEAEIRGHRRTYVASMPGRIIQGLRKAGTRNPVFMLDEVDKLGADFRGDPSAALLEVLDPEQNATFRDHYLDVAFDLSQVMFIATANNVEAIPPPLLDRMEVLALPGYSEEEKVLIAQRFLVPKQLEAHGLTPRNFRIADDAVKTLIADYTREAGLRNLEREVAALCRKVARRHAEGRRASVSIQPEHLAEMLGPPRYFREVADRTGVPGVATGLAWTPTGGEILFIEATAMPGKGALTLTGLLGESMRESAQAALSYLKSHAGTLHLDPSRLSKLDVHVHVPAGAVPKDGPSAGVAIAAALVSLFRHEPIRREVAMTGEVTLTGRVLPVGGVREKVLAARRAGLKEVLLPRHSEKELAELPSEVKADLDFQPVDTLDDVMRLLFAPRSRPKAKAKPTPSGPLRPKAKALDKTKEAMNPPRASSGGSGHSRRPRPH
jgi:ATP-dependent Lon protease